MIKFSRYTSEIFQRYAIAALIFLPLLAHATYQSKLNARLSAVSPEGYATPLPIAPTPIVSEKVIKSFFSKAMIHETTTTWDKVKDKYTRTESYYFSDDVWDELCANEFVNNTPEYFYTEKVNRSRVTLTDPVILSVRRANGNTYYLVQAKFLRTLRNKTGQQSRSFVTTGTVRVSPVTEQMSSLKVVDYVEGPA